MRTIKLLGIILLGIFLVGCSENEKKPTLSGKYNVEIVLKDYGTIKVTLDADEAPLTVENFLKLVDKKFYDGLTIHRVVKDFVIQGGDPEGTGQGGSEETIVGEFSSNGINNNLSHTRGTISMARNGMDMNSASSQFFIVQKDATTLDGDYAAFGYVTEGMDIVDKIVEEIEPNDEMGTVEKEKQPIITSIRKVTKKKANN